MKKRIFSIVLAIGMVLSIVPITIFAETDTGGTESTVTNTVPSVTAFATPEQLMTEFLPDKEGNAVTIGKLLFGKNSAGEPQEWYILGTDDGIYSDDHQKLDNITLFAANHMATGQMFSESIDNKTYNYGSDVTGYGNAGASGSIEVYPNHYGASDLNAKLNEMAKSDQYFSTGEQRLMNSVKITTNDAKNGNDYTFKSQLYAVAGDFNNGQKLWVGSKQGGTYIDVNDYYSDCACNNCENVFWIRNPYIDENINFFSLVSDSTGIGFCQVDTGLDILPAANLRMDWELFASSAVAATSDAVVSGFIPQGSAMTLRIIIEPRHNAKTGTAIYDPLTGEITVQKDSEATAPVTLVIQSNDGTNDWYFSKQISGTETVTASDIKREFGFQCDVDLSACKIWLETTYSDGLLYATYAERKVESINNNYATKNQLMYSFTPYSDGTAANYAHLVFGKNYNGEPQEWLIVGRDVGVSGDNTILVAATPLTSRQQFSYIEEEKYYSDLYNCTYNEVLSTPITIYPNHYGGSDVRAALTKTASDTNYFTSAEQNVMNFTTVTTIDEKNKVNYTTTDKLYALWGEKGAGIVEAGSDDSISLSLDYYWNGAGNGRNVGFWLRTGLSYASENPDYKSKALCAYIDSSVSSEYVNTEYGRYVFPAANLNLSSVLFASNVNASADAVSFGTIPTDTALRLRFDGSTKNLGSAMYNTVTGNIKIVRGRNTGTVTLVVQNGDDANNWYYSKQITADETVWATDIKNALGLHDDIDLSNCRIWLETTESNGFVYAVNADKELEKINTAFVTKDNLMASFTPYTDGTSANIAKITFGKNSNGEAQEWYVLGKDNDVSGDNVILFAANPIATNQAFSADTGNKTYNYPSGTGYGNASGSIEVYPNHYGASDLRTALNSMATDLQYFSATQQGMMNSTVVSTDDAKNNIRYTTVDKLYAPTSNGIGLSYKALKVGTNDNTAIIMNSYWSNGDWIPLRAPCADDNIYTLVAVQGLSVVDGNNVTNKNAVQPASNLNISNVLFASSAKASKAGVLAGDIAADTPMTLRLNGTDKAIGTVYYDATNGKISAQKDANATEAVSLVIQGNDGTKDWSYSVRISDKKIVTAEQIKYVCGIDDLYLANCNIWLETTIDDVSYANTAEAKTITEEPEKNIVIIEADMHAEGLVLGANTVADCKAELNTAEMYVEIKNINGEALANTDLVGTGATITYYDRTTNAAVKTVTVVLYGDVDGDGLVSTADKDTVMLKAVGAAEIENAWFLEAADANRDGVVDAFDAALINLQIANRYPIVQKLA